MFCLPENPVRKAIALAGGPTFVSNQLSLSNGAIHAWIRKGKFDILEPLSVLRGLLLNTGVRCLQSIFHIVTNRLESLFR
jgi:hypothetical protein